MGSMPTYHVSKGSYFGYLDDLFGGPNFMDAYATALNQLGNPSTTAATQLTTAANARRAQNPRDLSAGDVNHFTSDWMASWWKNLAVADTLRAGLVEAIKHAQSVHKPMEVLWVCSLDRAFQLYFNEGRNQVTVIVFTPPPDTGHTTTKIDRPEKIWVVKKEDQWDGPAYQAKGSPGVIASPEIIATVTSGPQAFVGDPIIKQQLFHT